MRDPRLDPRPGDVVKAKNGPTYTVTKRDGDAVYYDSYGEGVCTLWQWTNMSDTIVKVACETFDGDGWATMFDYKGRPAVWLHKSGLWVRCPTTPQTQEEVEATELAMKRAVANEIVGERVLTFTRIFQADLRSPE